MVIYAGQHTLLTIRGVSQGSADRWGIGIRWNSAIAGGPTQAMVDACVAPIRAWFTSTSSFFPLTTTVDEIKLAPIGTNGLYPPGLDSVVATIGTAITGTTSTAALPPQVAWVVSLTTPLPRGRGHIGRVYLPAFRSSIPLTNGRLGTAEVNGMLGTFKTMMNALTAIPNMFTPIVASPLGAPFQTITGLRGGLVLDTQRRRRDDLDEGYQLLAL
jgi:hypothetical protein